MAEIINDYSEMLAVGISNLVNIFEPEVVSIGGSFAYYEDIFLHRVESRMKLFNNFNKPNLLCAELKNDARVDWFSNNIKIFLLTN